MPLQAQAAGEPAAIVALFKETCLATEDPLNSVDELARAKGWQPDERLSHKLNQNQLITTKVWNVPLIEQSPVSVSVSKIKDQGNTTDFCIVLARRFSDPALESSLASSLGLGEAHKRETGNDEARTGWLVHGRPDTWVWYHSQTLTDGPSAQVGFVQVRLNGGQ
jgi:hypothetical protein